MLFKHVGENNVYRYPTSMLIDANGNPLNLLTKNYGRLWGIEKASMDFANTRDMDGFGYGLRRA